MIYQTGLLNAQLSRRMEQLGVDPSKPIYADSAEPKSIAELDSYRWYMIPTEKGADSRRARVSHLKEREVFYTESSEGIYNEHFTYSWASIRTKNRPTSRRTLTITASMRYPARYGPHVIEAVL